MVYSKEYTVTNSEMDSEYRLTPVGASMFFQDCFASFMTRYHLASFDLRSLGLMWIITEYSIRFEASVPFWSEKIRVDIWLSSLTSVKARLDYKMVHRGVVFAKGDCVWSMLESETRKPVIVKERLLNVPILPETVLGGFRHIIPETSALLGVYRHTLDGSDTDFNYHVNNVTYLRVCIDAIEAEFKKNHRLSFFTINFLQESFCGQELACSVYSTEMPQDRVLRLFSGNDCENCRAYMEFQEFNSTGSILDYSLLTRE